MKNVFRSNVVLNSVAFIGVILISIVIVVTIALVHPNFKNQQNQDEEHQRLLSQKCPAGYEEHPLIVISLDGFHPDYLEYGKTPVLQEIAEKGVSAPFMEPSFPTNTFPNHYSIVTGLYPNSHGIIDSRFYDPGLNKSFSRKTNALKEGLWWGGEPIWNTVQNQGKKSATYFWVGSEAPINGLYPTYWKPYDFSVSFNDRIDEALRWLTLPPGERPIWIAVYFNEPDRSGHKFGPSSPELKKKLSEVNIALKHLLDGIERNKLTNCVNIMVLSDHGMTDAGLERHLPLDGLMPDVAEAFEFSPKSLERFNLTTNNADVIKRVEDSFSCNDNFKLYHKKDLPKRIHFSSNIRIHDYVFLFKEGVTPTVDAEEVRLGEHGYDNIHNSMKSLFLASGPDFKRGEIIEPFKNVELYNLMCHLVGVTPSPNNGTSGALSAALTNPPSSLNTELPRKKKEFLQWPTEEESKKRMQESSCQTEAQLHEDISDLLSARDSVVTEDRDSKMAHLSPWGIPLELDDLDELVVLGHQDHITAFSTKLQIPCWASFTFTNKLMNPLNSTDWLTDVRLSAEFMPNCTKRTQYLLNNNGSLQYLPLFISEFCTNQNLQLETRLVSNAVPISSDLDKYWSYFLRQAIPKWKEKHGPLHLVLGSILDDSFSDDLDQLKGEETVLSTEMFAVILWCKDQVDQIEICEPSRLDVLSFIFPQKRHFKSCFTNEEFMQTFVATLDDVEKAAGLHFFPQLTVPIKTSLRLRLPIFPLYL